MVAQGHLTQVVHVKLVIHVVLVQIIIIAQQELSHQIVELQIMNIYPRHLKVVTQRPVLILVRIHYHAEMEHPIAYHLQV